jgi:branched-chain amino acid aminotransferase
LISDKEVITKPLDTSFLHGMTRDSILRLAAEIGYKVSERNFTVDELLQAVSTHEAALSGTAACLSPVGYLVYNGEEINVMDGNPGPNVERLRMALQDIQYGKAPDTHNWLTEIS